MAAESLQQLYEEDRQTVLEAIARDKTPDSVRAVLERELDRVMYRYLDLCQDKQLSESAQTMIAVLKSALPLISSIGDMQEWKRDVRSGEKSGTGPGPAVLVLRGLGILLLLGSFFAAAFLGIGSRTGPLSGLAMSAAGGVCLFFAGRRTGGRRAKKPGTEAAVRREFHVDAEACWTFLRNALIQMDELQRRMAEEAGLRRTREREEALASNMDPAELEVFSVILEAAYSMLEGENAEDAREITANIRFYLHGKDIEVLDYAEDRRGMFELLPGRSGKTLRPALIRDGKTVRKGLATA
ncbi:MAG: hypothetical protein IJH78_03715 [Clostridia bacterium]|nr:hypothetical protein [Clostridia bacterium]